jgi:hypothetical protein
MNLDLVIEIADPAFSLANNALNGTQPASHATATLLNILQKGALVYQQQHRAGLRPDTDSR